MARNKDNKDKENNNLDNHLQEKINKDSDLSESEKTHPTDSEPKNENGENNAGENKDGENKEKLKRIRAKSNTGFKNYYRCGLRFTPEFSDFEVNEETLDNLKKDIHLTIEEIAEA